MRRLKSTDIQISSFENAMTQFDQAAKRMRVDPTWIETIKQPRRSVTVKLPIQMDDGSFEVFTGYRVQHSIVRARAKGGVNTQIAFFTLAIEGVLHGFQDRDVDA